jgi:hypothetical protein
MERIGCGMAAVKLIDNFLPKFVHERIYEGVAEDPFIPYYYSSHVAHHTNEERDDIKQLMFVHTLYRDKKILSPWFDKIALPILDKLQVKDGKLLRVKINLNPNQLESITSAWHTDCSEIDNYSVAIYYCNTNNGYTEFEGGEKIKSVANRIALFDGQLKHRGITQTDTKGRFAVNINYETD